VIPAVVMQKLAVRSITPTMAKMQGTMMLSVKGLWVLKKSVFRKTAKISGIENVYPRREPNASLLFFQHIYF
jgi:hypothetical protein